MMRENLKIFECLRSCLRTLPEQFLVEIFAMAGLAGAPLLLAMKMLVTC